MNNNFLLILITIGSAIVSNTYAATKRVVVEGSSDICFRREIALNLAHSTALNHAYSECYSLGKGWAYSKIAIPGYEQCFACKDPQQFICKVTQATYECRNIQQEQEEEAAKKKREKELVDIEKKLKIAKDKLLELEKKPKKEKILKKNDTQPSLAESIFDGPTTNQPPLNASELLDEQAERPIVQKKLNQEVATYRYKATPGCQQILSDINVCYTRSNCQPRLEKEIQECYVNICGKQPSEKNCVSECWTPPRDTSNDRPGVNYISFPSCSQKCEPNPLFKTWKTCTENAKQCRVDEACVNRCNPNHFDSVDECLDKQVRTNGPTYNDAKKLMQKEWNQRAKTGGSLMNSILD